ncbi:hypothetical protein FOMG_11087 [Fusarium oxysporum f. sp. melonis 26406]|uniref:Uncharacterized protein n=1 Tax=Fusarium oxysporum f. sp. melonis 26406 TaxID=1089452 RepID=W9ZPY1_FUSOX|nr:hypothetical protein FOMG_11087 [Fusarium oxysporum f. sp. melonis 26406]
MIEDQLSHLRYFASLAPSSYNPKCIYGDEEYENINEIFPNHYGATQVSFLKSLVIDMMCHLRQLGEMCIFPMGTISTEANECWVMATSMLGTSSTWRFPTADSLVTRAPAYPLTRSMSSSAQHRRGALRSFQI